MLRSTAVFPLNSHAKTAHIGVGLRHPHYQDALDGTSAIDFVEVHSENFFAEGGASREVLSQVADIYPVSLHCTSMGLGSAQGVNKNYLQRLKALVDNVRPILVSDHASFAWGEVTQPIHAGDLLPLEFTRESLNVLIDNVNRVQQSLGRQILVENLSSYIQLPAALSETEFLVTLAEQTQCGLLVDLNNLLVNAHNFSSHDPLQQSKLWLDEVPAHLIGEVHLAGYTQVSPGELAIDDHSQAVSDGCWELYAHVIDRCGPLTTLVEWDNNLPSWQVLLEQASLAREIVGECLNGKQNQWKVAQ